MKYAIFIFAILLVCVTFAAPQKIDGLYVNTFGDVKNQALIFIHGGPGYNSWDFELTTAAKLASLGYYVVVYDERGQGRSDETDTKNFNYKRYADDLKTLIETLNLRSPIFLGHSHGGEIAIKFDQLYPSIVKKIILVSAPLNMWGVMHDIFENCSRNYVSRDDQKDLDSLTYLYYQFFANPNLSSGQIPHFVSAIFMAGAQCGLYKVRNPAREGERLHKLYAQNPLPGPLSGLRTAVTGFIQNENYIHLNETDYVAENQSRYCGIYADEDGLFTPLELNLVKVAIGSQQFHLIKGASHALYLDQQSLFFTALESCGVKPTQRIEEAHE